MVESQDTSLSGRPAAGRPERVCFVLHVNSHRLEECKAREAMEARDINARWQAEMAEFFGTRADRSLERLEEVFHLA